jgi:hypothetical protein
VKKSKSAKVAKDRVQLGDGIAAYSRAQPPSFRAICETLRESITTALPEATSKVWHGSPVWFIEENPVVGYSATSKAVTLLFWNGRAFDEPDLEPMGKHRAAQARFADVAEIDVPALRRWLKKAKADVFDSRAYFKKLRARK